MLCFYIRRDSTSALLGVGFFKILANFLQNRPLIVLKFFCHIVLKDSYRKFSFLALFSVNFFVTYDATLYSSVQTDLLLIFSSKICGRYLYFVALQNSRICRAYIFHKTCRQSFILSTCHNFINF